MVKALHFLFSTCKCLILGNFFNDENLMNHQIKENTSLLEHSDNDSFDA